LKTALSNKVESKTESRHNKHNESVLLTPSHKSIIKFLGSCPKCSSFKQSFYNNIMGIFQWHLHRVAICPLKSALNWNLEMLLLRKAENQSIQRKTSQSREENQQQTQPTHACMPTLPDNPGVARIQNESLCLPYG